MPLFDLLPEELSAVPVSWSNRIADNVTDDKPKEALHLFKTWLNKEPLT